MSGEIKQRSVPLHIIPVSPRATRPPLLFNVFLRSRPAEIKLWDVLSWQRRTRCRQGSRGPHVKLSVAYIIDRVYYVCKTGCQWSTLEVEGGSYKTIFHYFNLWSKARLFEHAFFALSSSKPFITGPLSIDTSFVKNVFGRDVIGRNPTDRGRKATKVSAMASRRLCVRLLSGATVYEGPCPHSLEELRDKVAAAMGCERKDELVFCSGDAVLDCIEDAGEEITAVRDQVVGFLKEFMWHAYKDELPVRLWPAREHRRLILAAEVLEAFERFY